MTITYADDRSHLAVPLEQCLLGLALLGGIAMLSLPIARGSHAALGWMPLWLLAMPLASWCALRLARWMRPQHDAAFAASRPRRRSSASPASQRRGAGVLRRTLRRAA